MHPDRGSLAEVECLRSNPEVLGYRRQDGPSSIPYFSPPRLYSHSFAVDVAETGLGRTSRRPSRRTVIAIGDVHGAFDDFVAILQRTGLTDQQNHWTGGKTTFVQVGDLLDRGPKPREVMDLMIASKKKQRTSRRPGCKFDG